MQKCSVRCELNSMKSNNLLFPWNCFSQERLKLWNIFVIFTLSHHYVANYNSTFSILATPLIVSNLGFFRFKRHKTVIHMPDMICVFPGKPRQLGTDELGDPSVGISISWKISLNIYHNYNEHFVVFNFFDVKGIVYFFNSNNQSKYTKEVFTCHETISPTQTPAW